MMSSADMLTFEERNLIEAECTRLIAGYAYYVDRRRYADLVALFTEDGVLERPTSVATGSQGLLEAMEARSAAIATRHINGTPFFESVTRDEARAVTYMIMYVVEGTDEGPNEVPGTAGLGEFHDLFRRTEKGWRIARRVAKSAMIVKR